MQKIEKGEAPTSLTKFKRSHTSYSDLPGLEKQDIRDSCTVEQFYLCAYCCQEISGKKDDTSIEHIETQKSAPNRSLDFTNLVASCTTKNQCNAGRGSQVLELTPLMPACETELEFTLGGRVHGLTDGACEAIKVLNLGDKEQNNRVLIEKRKQLVDSLIWAYSHGPAQLRLEEDHVLQSVIHDLAQAKNGKFSPFAPVLINILRTLLSA